MASKMGIYGCLAVVALLLHVAPAASKIIPVKLTDPSSVIGKNFERGDIKLKFLEDAAHLANPADIIEAAKEGKDAERAAKAAKAAASTAKRGAKAAESSSSLTVSGFFITLASYMVSFLY